MFEPGCKLKPSGFSRADKVCSLGKGKEKESFWGKKQDGRDFVTNLCSLVNSWRSLCFEAEVTIHDRADKIF